MNFKNELIELKNRVFNRYAKNAYSQEGEDLVLNRIFDGQKSGFYVDVGAHHPMRFSNTYFFYKKGWNGINIDPMPGSMNLFNRLRPRDINLELGISQDQKELTYHIFNDTALNGFDDGLSKSRELLPGYQVVKKIKIQTTSLAEVMKKYLPTDQKVDFLSIDAEGLDMEVLRSNDWSRFKPTVILVELLNVDLTKSSESEAVKFLAEHGYKLYAKTVNTFIFSLR